MERYISMAAPHPGAVDNKWFDRARERRLNFYISPVVSHLLLGLISMFWPFVASAENFYWRIDYAAGSPTPSLEQTLRGWSSGDEILNEIKIIYSGQPNIKCSVHPSRVKCSTSIWNQIGARLRGTTCPIGTVFDDKILGCKVTEAAGRNKGLMDEGLSCQSASSGPTGTVGNPIKVAGGWRFQKEQDYSGGVNGSLGFSRFYNSQDGLWSHTYSAHLEISNDSILFVDHDGRQVRFRISNGEVIDSRIDDGVLAKNDGGWIYRRINGENYIFDDLGRLITIEQKGGRKSLSYENDLVVVRDQLGGRLEFKQTSMFSPLSFTVENTRVEYGYDSLGYLSFMEKDDSGLVRQRQYHYEDPRNNALLTGITDERGVRYATWAYDDQGRAISSEHADGAEKVLIAYNADGSSTVTNELGKKTTYRFQTIEGVKRITAIEGEPSTNCPNSNSTFTYDSRGLLKTKTDNKGHLTTFDYNERGLEVSRTEAAGTPQARTVTTDWHPTLFLPITVTEPSRITHYTYDDQGRQLSQSVTQR